MPIETTYGMIAADKIKCTHHREMGDIDSLAESIKRAGVIHPLVLDARNRVIVGRRRFEAMKKLGWKRMPCIVNAAVKDEATAAMMALEENVARKDLTPEEAVYMRQELRDLLHVSKETQADLESKEDNRAGKLPEGQQVVVGEVDEVASKPTGYSRRTLDAAEEVVDAAAENPALRPIVDEMNVTGNVSAAKRKVKAAKPKASPPPTPEPAPEPTGLELAVAGIAEIREAVEAARAVTRRVLGIEGKEVTADYLCRFTWSGTVGVLNELLRELEAWTPVGGTARKPVVRRDRDLEMKL